MTNNKHSIIQFKDDESFVTYQTKDGKIKKVKYKTFIIGLLRRGTLRWPPANDAWKAAKTDYYITSKNGKQLKRCKYKCAKCGNFFKRDDCELDHKEPVVDPKRGVESLDEYAKRMFPPTKDHYQVLCQGCHEKKTKAETEERTQYRKLNKK